MKELFFGLLTKFVPNLIPGLSALMNPWIWVIALSAVTSSFLFGVYLEHGRFEAHLEQDKAAQASYDAWAKIRNVFQFQANKEVVNDLKTRNGKLVADNAQLLDSLSRFANQSVLPPRPDSSAGGDSGRTICIDRERYDAGDRAIREAESRIQAETVARLKRARSVVQSCLEWDAKQRKVRQESPEPTQ